MSAQRWLSLSIVVTVLCVGLTGWAGATLPGGDSLPRTDAPEQTASGPSGDTSRRVMAERVDLTESRHARVRRILARWDARRAEAWAAGDVRGLRRLYARGSSAGRADVAMLRAWNARGAEVHGMRRQVFSARVLASGPRRIRVRVTDRLVGALVVVDGTQRELPASAPQTRVLRLVRARRAWRMASVREVSSARGQGSR